MSKEMKENPMRKIKIEKVVLSIGAVSPQLEKGKKLLELMTGRKAQIVASSKRIPDFGVRPGLEVGTVVTLRGKEAEEMLKRLLASIDNRIRKRQVAENHFGFGIKEYIEIPGLKYQRDIGILGLSVDVSFIRTGLRVKRKKIKPGKVPKRQMVSKEEIIKILEDVYQTTIK